MKELVNDGFAKVVKPYIDAQDKKSREIIAPVEVSPAEAAHSIGDQIIFNGILYDVIEAIEIDDPLSTTGAGANIEPADNIYEQIEAQKAEIQTVRAQAAANNKSTQEMIAPVEEDETDASRAYEIGEQLILDGILYDVIDDIAQHGIITAEGAGANIEEADTIAEQIKNKTITTDAVPTQGSTNPVQSGGTFDAILDEAKTRGELGAKNILPFDLAEIKALNTNGTWAGNVYTYRGVAFTVNSDGTISATGTATGGNASIKLFAASSNYEMLGKEVILTGCPSNGSASTYRIQAYRMASADGSTGTYFDDGAGTDAFTVLNDASETVGSFAVAVYENATVTNLLFKPMVRLASDPDATYQPYAKTNQELTAENQTLTNQLGDITQLATTDKSSAVAAINEVNTALGNKASTTDVNNKHKLTIETVSTSGWTADSTSQSGTTLYKKSISLNHVYVESPAVDIATSSGTGLPTAAQQTAYDLLQYVTVDGTTLYLYASAIPSTQFYIGVEGVD